MTQTPSSAIKPWLVCLGSALFFYFVFFQLAMFNSISHVVMSDFNITPTQLGYLSSSYFFADALCIIPAGILLDRFSTRKLSLFVMLLCILTTYLFACTNSYGLALTARIINGIGNAFAFLSSMQLATRWLPAKRRALGISLIITIFMMGGMIAQTPFMLLISCIGWRWAMGINASLGVVFLVYMFFYLQDYPEGQTSTTKHISIQAMGTQFLAALKNPQNWLCSWYITLMNFPIILLGELWGIMYLTQAKQLSATTAGNIASMLFVGMIIGAPIVGWVSDKLQRRCLPMIISSSLLLIFTLLIMFDNHLSTSHLDFAFLIIGLLSSGQSIGYPTLAESNPPAIISMAMSIVAILLNLVSFFVQPLFGWLMHLSWNGAMQNNTPIYTAHDFALAMWLLPIACLISIIIAFVTRETHAKGQA